MQKGLLDIAKLLADSGVDCGAGDSLLWVFSAMLQTQNNVTMDLSRIIMTRSHLDPLSDTDFIMIWIEFSDHLLSVLSKQDEWDLTELRASIEDYWGKGSFQYMIDTGGDSDD